MEDKKLEKVLQDMSFSLNHIEDIMADDRAIIIKLVKQSNTIVEFLKGLEIEEVDISDAYKLPEVDSAKDSEKFEQVRDLVDKFMEKKEDLEELERELKKYKDDIVPGKVGEA